jgi:hypothetical protein
MPPPSAFFRTERGAAAAYSTGGRRCFLTGKAMGFFDKLKQMFGGGQHHHRRRPSRHEKRAENEPSAGLHQPRRLPGSISRILCGK